jgi:hypothetical protein
MSSELSLRLRNRQQKCSTEKIRTYIPHCPHTIVNHPYPPNASLSTYPTPHTSDPHHENADKPSFPVGSLASHKLSHMVFHGSRVSIPSCGIERKGWSHTMRFKFQHLELDFPARAVRVSVLKRCCEGSAPLNHEPTTQNKNN